MRAIRLETEFLTDPIGIGVSSPRLTWQCEGGEKQTAYRIVAYADGVVVWDSGKVLSSDMHVVYPRPLASRLRVEYTVMLWDEKGEKGEKSKGLFEMGLLSPSDFTAKWIAGDYRVRPKTRYPVDCFRKVFSLSSVVKGRLYITACGLYEARLNGKRVGEFVLAPGHTDYRKRIRLQTYDVTDLLRAGENELTCELADGWYRGSCGAWGRTNQYGKQTKLYAQLEITCDDGSVVVCSDETWEWSNDGAIRFADNKDGEIVEAFRVPSYAGRARVARCDVIPTASDNVPVVEHERLTVQRVIRTPKGATVLDFGQNVAGYCAFTLNAREGRKVVLRFGEMLDREGEFTQKNIQCANRKGTRVTPLQRVEYHCKEGENAYKTKFAVFGFQYVLVETDAEWQASDFTAIAVYSDLRETLSFSCSDPLIEKFVENTRWSAKNNHADVPTDCPTRERHGWTGDAQIFCNTASYFFEYAAFGRKYINDMKDGQKRNGCFRQIVPPGGVDKYMEPMDGSAGWSDAGVLIPYRLYEKYGDKRFLEDNYDAMRRYALYKIKTLGKFYPTALPTGLSRKFRKMISNYGQSYGEWAEPADVKPFSIADFISPHPEETTAYLVYMLDHMEKTALLLGKTDDAHCFKKYSEIAKTGYRKLIERNNSLDTDRQAKLVRPLYMKLTDDKQTSYAQARLLQALDHYDWRLGTGFLSTPFILYVLADMNIEYAYRLLENKAMPGWLYMPKTGANTIWESWEGPDAQGGVASLDHYSKGAVCEWIFDTMCGIRVVGDRHFLLAPKVGGTLTSARCSYDSVYGAVSTHWERTPSQTVYTFTVPPNTTATAILPNGTFPLSPGRHTFTIES